MMSLHTGTSASPFLIAQLERAFQEHREGGLQLADSFGCDRHGNEAQAIVSELVARQVFALVNELHSRYPKRHPEHLPLSRAHARTRKSGLTAYSRAGQILSMGESAVVKHYTRGKSLPDHLKGAGID